MSKWHNFRTACLFLLIILTIINFLVLLSIIPKNSFTSEMFFIITGILSFILWLITINIGGKYVLYAYLFLFTYGAYAGIGEKAAMVGEPGIIYVALKISIPSFFLLLICIAILIRKHLKEG